MKAYRQNLKGGLEEKETSVRRFSFVPLFNFSYVNIYFETVLCSLRLLSFFLQSLRVKELIRTKQAQPPSRKPAAVPYSRTLPRTRTELALTLHTWPSPLPPRFLIYPPPSPSITLFIRHWGTPPRPLSVAQPCHDSLSNFLVHHLSAKLLSPVSTLPFLLLLQYTSTDVIPTVYVCSNICTLHK